MIKSNKLASDLFAAEMNFNNFMNSVFNIITDAVRRAGKMYQHIIISPSGNDTIVLSADFLCKNLKNLPNLLLMYLMHDRIQHVQPRALGEELQKTPQVQALLEAKKAYESDPVIGKRRLIIRKAFPTPMAGKASDSFSLVAAASAALSGVPYE